MKELTFGLLLSPKEPAQVFEYSLLAEKCGFDYILVSDHLVNISLNAGYANALEAYTSLTAIAMKTKRIRLGAITDIQRRHPADLAQIVATLDHFSKGRVIVVAAAGEAINIKPFGIRWEKPVSQLKEAIEVMKKLWTENHVDYGGEFFHLKEAFLYPKPLQKPHPPIWVAANRPKTVKLTAELGDGWLPGAPFMTIETYKKYFMEISNLRTQMGKRSNFVASCQFPAAIAEDNDTARRLIEPIVRFLLVTSKPSHLKAFGVEVPEKFDWLNFIATPNSIRELVDYMSKIPIEVVEDHCIFGNPDVFIEKMEDWIEAGVQDFNFLFPEKGSIKLFNEKVMPHFKR